MECKDNIVIHGQECDTLRIKEEHFSLDEINEPHLQQTDTHFMKCVQSSDVDTKDGIKQETWDPNAPYSDTKSDPMQSYSYLSTSTIKCFDEIDTKQEYVFQDEGLPDSQGLHLQQKEIYLKEHKLSEDVNTKVEIKQEAWDPNEVSGGIKCEPEQPPILDPVPFIYPGEKEGDDETVLNEGLGCCEEISANSVNEREKSGSKQNEEAEDVPLKSPRSTTDAVYSTSANLLQENKDIRTLAANTNTPAQNCETKYRFKTSGKGFKLLSHLKVQNLVHKCYKRGNHAKNFIYLGALTDNQIKNDSIQYLCDTCGKSFSKLKNFKMHLLVHNERQYKCQICGRSFKQLPHLNKHLLVHDDKKPFHCEVCAKSFKRLTDLKNHLVVHEDKKQFMCEICAKGFKRLTHLKIHLLVHDDKRPYTCQFCEKSFKMLSRLKLHLLVHDDIQKYKCEVCGKSFKQLSNLKKHLLVHDDKRPYKCPMCEKTFKCLHSLKSHIFVHDDKRQFKCQSCKKSFKQLGHLKTHLLVHEDKRQFRCENCGKSFKLLNTLKSHLLIHDDKRLHKCQICEKSFKREDVFKKHLLVHDDNGQYKCHICEKSFKRLHSMKTHRLIHNKREYKCQDLCEKFQAAT